MWLKFVFFVVLILTLLGLLLPAVTMVTFKEWVSTWLPGGRWIDQANLTTHSDKWTHALLFLALGWLAMRAWQSRHHRQGWAISLLGLAVVTEVLQAWVPGRSPSLADFVADALGLAVGAGLGWWAFSRAPARAI